MKRSSLVAGSVLFGGLLLAGGALALYKSNELSAASADQASYEPTESVDIVQVERLEWQPMYQLVGTVVAIRSIMLSNEIAGVVSTVGFESGDIVEKGQPLIQLDDTTTQADLQAARALVRVAQANVAQAKARIQLAERMVSRLESVTGRAVAQADLDRERAELDTAQAELSRWEAEVDQAVASVAQVESRLAKLTLHAPFRARAGMRNTHEGQYLAEGSEIVSLQEITDSIYLDFLVPQEYASRATPGTVVRARGEMFGKDPVDIRVVSRDAVVNNNTRNLRVRAMVDNAEGRLSPGMFVQISVGIDEARSYPSVPVTAIRRAAYGDSVFVVEGEGGEQRARQRFVELGPAVGERVIIHDGLTLDERVASTGSFKLHNGALVAQAEPAPAPAQAQTAAHTGASH